MKNIIHYFEERLLVARFQQGDHAAFEALYQIYARRVFALVLPLVEGCHADAEDLVQETFIAAFRATESFRGNSHVLTWLFGIALRRFRDEKRRNRPVTLLYYDEHDLPQEAAVSLEHSVINDLWYQQALSELPENQRVAFVLIASQKLTHKEAARLLNTPVATIKWRVAQAAKYLRAALSESSDQDKEKKEGILCVPCTPIQI